MVALTAMSHPGVNAMRRLENRRAPAQAAAPAAIAPAVVSILGPPAFAPIFRLRRLR